MSNELKTERIQMLMEPSLRRAINDVRFENRLGSEGEAIRLLLMEALAARAGAGGVDEEPRPIPHRTRSSPGR